MKKASQKPPTAAAPKKPVIAEEAGPATQKIETKFGVIYTIPGVKTSLISVLLIGTAPLIVHNFSSKLRRQILDRHMGEASAGREKKDPVANYEAARYISNKHGWHGIPAAGLKACFVDGFGKGSGVPMTQARSIRVLADDPKSNPQLVRLLHPQEPKEIEAMPHYPNENGRSPRCREDVVRNESGVVDIRHRPEYMPWGALVRIEFLPQVCSEKQLLQAVAMSGFRIGQCEWRPGSKESKSGSFGTFRLATSAEVEQFENDELFADFDWSEAAEGMRVAAE